MTYQLHLGDCLPFMRGLPDGCIDAVITDPPYGLGKRMNGGNWGAKNKEMMAWDMAALDEFVAPLLKYPVVAIWGGNYYALPPSRGWLTWFKRDAPPSMAQFEMAWTNQDINARQFDWPIAATNAERVPHPTQKPVALMKWTMDVLKVPIGATVFDPFAGSGSVGVACMKTGRNYIGCEIDPTYHAIATRRIEAAAAQGIFDLSPEATP